VAPQGGVEAAGEPAPRRRWAGAGRMLRRHRPPAWSSRDPHDTRRGLGDPDARVGRGKKGFLLGYRSLFLVDIEGFPLGHVEAPLNVNEKQMVESLLERVLGEDIEVELLVADSQIES